MHDRRPIYPGSPAWHREQELIASIRSCLDCRPREYVVCPYHDAALLDLYGTCDDPRCPACR